MNAPYIVSAAKVSRIALVAAMLLSGIGPLPSQAASPSLPTTTPIKNVVVIYGENISFDHHFATYPNALNNNPAEPSFTARAGTPSVNGLTGVYATANPSINLASTGTVSPVRLSRSQAETCDMNHNYTDEQVAYHGGQGNNFIKATGAVPTGAGAANQYCLPDNSTVLSYYDGNTVQAMWNYAQHFALNDNSYGTTFGPTTLGHVNLISGNTHGVVGTTQSNVTVYSINAKTGKAETSAVTIAGSDVDTAAATAGAGTPGGGGTMVGDLRPVGDDCASSGNIQGTFGSSGRNVGDLLNAAGASWGWFAGGFAPTVPFTAGVQPPASPANALVPGNAAYCGAVHQAGDGTLRVDYAASQEPFQLYASTQNLHHTAKLSPAEVGHAGPANHQYDISDLFVVSSTSTFANPDQSYTITGLQPGVTLPAVTFIKAPGFMTAHPQYSNPLLEQRFVAQVVNALMQSSYWPNMAIILAYDDSDGWYDHVVPPLVNPSQTAAGAPTESSDGLTGNSTVSVSGGVATYSSSGSCGLAASGAVMGRCGYGPRLPLLVISPYAKLNFVDHTLTDQSSILRFIEDNWSLGRIDPSPKPVSAGGSFDQIAGPLLNMFDFTKRHSLNGLILNPADGTVVSGANDL